MRMRKKPNLDARMERSGAALVDAPETLRGRWLDSYPGHKMLAVELGCGKGRFTVDTAQAEPELFIAAVERVPEAVVVGMERAVARGVENVRFIDMDVAELHRVFAPGEADRIYINFCDPWPGKGHAHRRLTAPDFLTLYRTVLKPGGEIHFKTDNVPLFDWSVEQFERCGWELVLVTHDLHKNGVCEVMTDYEAKFHAQGMPICKCVARRSMTKELPMVIEEMRPTNVLCLPVVPGANSRTAAQERMLTELKTAMDESCALNIGWLSRDEGGNAVVDEEYISTALIYDDLSVEGINQMLSAGAMPETLPGARYAVFETTQADFRMAWGEMLKTVDARGYALDELKPVLWRLSSAMLHDSMCQLCIPVKYKY